MGWPKRNSRKGLMQVVINSAHELQRDWCPFNGKWQPSAKLREITKRKIANLRDALNDLENSL